MREDFKRGEVKPFNRSINDIEQFERCDNARNLAKYGIFLRVTQVFKLRS